MRSCHFGVQLLDYEAGCGLLLFFFYFLTKDNAHYGLFQTGCTCSRGVWLLVGCKYTTALLPGAVRISSGCTDYW